MMVGNSASSLQHGASSQQQTAATARWNRQSLGQWSKNQKSPLSEEQVAKIKRKYTTMPQFQCARVEDAVSSLPQFCPDSSLCIVRTSCAVYLMWRLGALTLARKCLASTAADSEDDFPLGVEARKFQCWEVPESQESAEVSSPSEREAALSDEIHELSEALEAKADENLKLNREKQRFAVAVAVKTDENSTLAREKQRLGEELSEARSRSRSRGQKHRQEMLSVAAGLEAEAACFEAKARAYRTKAAEIRAPFM